MRLCKFDSELYKRNMTGSIMTQFRDHNVTFCAKKPAAVHKCCTEDEKSDSGAHFRPQRPIKSELRLGPREQNLHLITPSMMQWPASGTRHRPSPPEPKRTQIWEMGVESLACCGCHCASQRETFENPSLYWGTDNSKLESWPLWSPGVGIVTCTTIFNLFETAAWPWSSTHSAHVARMFWY